MLASHAATTLRGMAVDAELVDLRNWPLPLCDGTHEQDPDGRVSELTGKVAGADAVVLAVPIYNWMVNAAAKNLIEHTGAAWRGKRVGLLCAAGGGSSYMGVMSLANAVTMDFRCVVLPGFVYATGRDFEGDAVVGQVAERVGAMCEALSAGWSLEGAGRIERQEAMSQRRQGNDIEASDQRIQVEIQKLGTPA